MFAESHVWHYWIAVPLVVGAVLFIVATLVGYLVNVVKPKYPPRSEG
jgi:uncharacterized membrane protein YpjA